jgi:hypothetical protein
MSRSAFRLKPAMNLGTWLLWSDFSFCPFSLLFTFYVCILSQPQGVLPNITCVPPVAVPLLLQVQQSRYLYEMPGVNKRVTFQVSIEILGEPVSLSPFTLTVGEAGSFAVSATSDR